MRKLFYIIILVIIIFPMTGQAAVIDNTRGYILLQVEKSGEAWYVNPADDSRSYMKDGAVAYQMMRNFGLGITDLDLSKIPMVSDTTTMKNSSSICSSNSLANRLKGKILLQVQQNGEAWYIYPKTCRRIYMKDGEAAYSIMRFLGLGITDQNLLNIPMAEQDLSPVEPVIVNNDFDNDGILNSQDDYPNGGSPIKTKIYNMEMLQGNSIDSWQLSVNIPFDRYSMYTKYYTHSFTENFTNITSFVTSDDPVIQAIGNTITQEMPNYSSEMLYRLIAQIFYLSDYNTGFNEYPKYPVETLQDGNGDCEDSAFLLASLLKNLKKDVALLIYSNHAAVGVAMTDAEINAYDSFISAENDLLDQILLLEMEQGSSSRTPAVQWIFDGWSLYHSLQYYEFNGKKYVYLESTAKDLWLSIGQVPEEYQNEIATIFPIK